MGRITIRTVAEACGVSPSTVSNAYNRPGQLSAALRERILATAEELGYPGPSAAGRSLRSGRAGAIGVLLSNQLSYAFSDPYAIGFLVGVTQACERAGVSVLLLSAEHPEGGPDLSAIQRANIDGIITLTFDTHPSVLEHARRRGLPVVTTYPGAGDHSVAVDDVRAGELVGAHLHGLGHRRVACVVGTSSSTGTPVTAVEALADLDYVDRVTGLRSALPDAEVTIFSARHNSFDTGRAAADAVLAVDPWPTAVVCSSDVLALGLQHELRERGVQVPGQISVAGFDDIDEAAIGDLTTVAQPIVDKGRLAAGMLLGDDAGPAHVLLEVSLVARGSTAPPRG
ncbi:LacI family DNA-binding transcriptional regulator [Auraticoccus sp. F435]|uniref:LacI family DNA-binding transcriptional regulator n=1 Tax=Auraticoccus cholistanensis TaxID=2656650 RepID=A0A6A9V1T1_9ACTN|nr:LacI family DNA-binding transcriptional regulator [Auraticoccus cholistanensis]MVA77545.1 LacI family DNA-binding transcriptional regulator [Auraticoccus cholistanensis]